MNDVDRIVNESIVDGSTYYTLGYRPTSNSTEAGKFRKIKVVCLRPGLTATTHDGYYTSASTATLATDTIGYDLNNAATASIPFNGIAFTVDSAEPGSFTLHVRSSDLDWHHAPGGAGAQSATVQVLVVALNAKQRILTHTLHNETATAPLDTDTHAATQRVRFSTKLETNPKATTLRFVVRDQLTGHMGTFDLPIHP